MKAIKIKEPVNALTHFSMFLIGIIGLILLIVKAYPVLGRMFPVIVFGASVLLLYGASALYHWVDTTPEKTMILKKLDHIAIYILIAGTYTPILTLALEGSWRISMLIIIWAVALIGIVLKIFFIKIPRSVSTALYIVMGWMALIPFPKLIAALPTPAIVLLVLGGVLYTIGGLIYATKKFDFLPDKFGFHEVFHIFVMLGTLAHYAMIYFYVLPL